MTDRPRLLPVRIVREGDRVELRPSIKDGSLALVFGFLGCATAVFFLPTVPLFMTSVLSVLFLVLAYLASRRISGIKISRTSAEKRLGLIRPHRTIREWDSVEAVVVENSPSPLQRRYEVAHVAIATEDGEPSIGYHGNPTVAREIGTAIAEVIGAPVTDRIDEAALARSRQTRLRSALVIVVVCVLAIAANMRGIETRIELDLTTGQRTEIRRGFWGGVDTQPGKPWREDELKSLFESGGEPLPIVLLSHHQDIIPGRRSGRRSTTTSVNKIVLSQILSAPHLSDEKRRELLRLAARERPSDVYHHRQFDHLRVPLKNAVIDATELPAGERERLKSVPSVIEVLRVAAEYPARAK